MREVLLLQYVITS